MNTKIDASHILKTGFGFWESKVLLTAVELELFSVLSGKRMSGEDLGSKLGFHPRGIWGFFDALVALGFCSAKATVERRFTAIRKRPRGI
jgi:methyltransferase family protein